MTFYSISGKKKKLKNYTKYLIKWDGDSRSKFQKLVKRSLHQYWRYDVVFEELPVLGSRMTLDFYNASKQIALEVDGVQHYKFTPFFHRNRGQFLQQVGRDDLKERFCELNNIKIIRITPSDEVDLDLFKQLGIV